MTEEQDNSTTQSPICTPQNLQDKIDTTKETEQTITRTLQIKQNEKTSSEESSNHKVVQTDEINRYVPKSVFDTFYENYIEFKHYINVLNNINYKILKDINNKWLE